MGPPALSPLLSPAVPAVLLALALVVWPARPGPARFVARGVGALRPPASGELSVPDVVDLLALALEGGAGTVAALRQVADRLPGAAGTELRTVAAALEWGQPEATAWSSVPDRWAPTGRALRLAALAGVPPATQLRRAAQDERREQIAGIEQATARLGVRLVLPLGLIFLPAFVLTTIVPVVLALAGALLSPAG